VQILILFSSGVSVSTYNQYIRVQDCLLYSGHIIDTCCVFLDKLITFIYVYIVALLLYIVFYKIISYFKLRVTYKYLFND